MKKLLLKKILDEKGHLSKEEIEEINKIRGEKK